MKRDGYQKSIWQYKKDDYSNVDQVVSSEFDVIIAGGGITGLTTGLLLQKAGKKCMVAEAQTVGFGTTGGNSAHLNTIFDTPYHKVKENFSEAKAILLAQGAQQALALIKHNIAEHQIECAFEEKDGYIFSMTEEQDEELDKLVTSTREAGLLIDLADESPLPIPFRKIARIKGQAQFQPLDYVFGLARAFEAAGGLLLTGCRVTAVEEGDELEVSTTRGTFNARNLIWATHIPPGVNLLHFRAAPYRSYVMGLILNNDAYPQALAYDMENPYHYYSTHNIHGQNYLIAGGEDHKTAHEDNTEECFRRLESYLRKHFDVKEVSFKWSSQYYEPADGLPYIGNFPGNGDNIYAATGFGGNGLTYGTLSAIMLSDMITKTNSEFISLFDPNRMKPVAGFSNFIKEAADVVKHLIGEKFSVENIKEIADLAAGEAKVVKYNGVKIAMYKDENHNLHCVNPSCTHIHCTVSWNTAEKSWDCPCHGARYSYTGEVLNGPATRGLEIIDIGTE